MALVAAHSRHLWPCPRVARVATTDRRSLVQPAHSCVIARCADNFSHRLILLERCVENVAGDGEVRYQTVYALMGKLQGEAKVSRVSLMGSPADTGKGK